MAGRKTGNLKTKLLLIYFSFAVSIPVFVYLFSFEIYSRDTVNIEAALFDYAITQTSVNFSEVIREYKNVVAQIATNSNMTALFKLADQTADGSPSSAKIINQLSDAFAAYTRMNSYIASAALISNSGKMVLYQRLGSETFFRSKLRNAEFYQAFLKYSGKEYFHNVNIMQAATLSNAPPDTKHYVYYTYPAADMITKEVYGALVLEVETSVFDMVNINHGNTIIDKHISTSSCITLPDGTIISSPLAENVGKNIGEITSRTSAIIRSVPIDGSSLILHLFFEHGSLQQYIDRYRNIAFVFILGSMAVFSIIIVYIINRLMLRSEKIANAIGQFRKTHQVSAIDIDSNDEVLFAIADQFNMMSGEIEKLVRELQEKNENIRQAKDQQRHAEIQALQAQINPHFIYNALDRINWIAIENDQNEISHMLSELGSLLRYSISNIDVLVTLDAELDWMEKYIYIQSERFGHKIILRKDVGNNARDFPIYKMLLQPLVENSILHGFRTDSEDPEIQISASVLPDGRLKIDLSDNGCGMDEKVLEQVRGICRHDTVNDRDSVGIANVANRIWHYYGERSEITLDSRLDRGTVFHLLIPCRK